MARLAVNVDHVATVRQSRLVHDPDPVAAAILAELAGCHSIIVHLREDRRHICDRDVEILKKVLSTQLNLEMAATEEMVGIARAVKPAVSCLVPEKRQELTTEGGLDVAGCLEHISRVVESLHSAGILVSLFVDPEPRQIQASRNTCADIVELHTGTYSNAHDQRSRLQELEKVAQGAALAASLGLRVHAGHGLDYHNVAPMVKVPEITEYSIGHSIIARAVLVGMERAVAEMVALVRG